MATGNEIMRNLFLSTLPARGATRSLSLSSAHTRISIHAPREGSDLLQRFEAAQFMYNFYPRSPRGERLTLLSAQCACSHFYPRSPRGERPAPCAGCHGYVIGISIHAPREGSDHGKSTFMSQLVCISIHAPREGSDVQLPYCQPRRRCISIHAPREGSDYEVFGSCSIANRFLSTLPARGATQTPCP